ncbi:MAG: helix-turn-helix transcriptional regulator [Peptococcaceae bacterium]|nr:helix-turn-helix transcriptional regulator [Peptococcaceae bacterium]
MSQDEQQALAGAMDILAQPQLPEELAGAKLYGAAEALNDELGEDCKIFHLANDTGTGRITVYQVFSGIELYYNDMHLGCCNQNQATAKNMIEINHCAVGRFECSFGENSCCYMSEGDLAISAGTKRKSDSCFPLNHYHGISIIINFDALLPEVEQIMALLNIDLGHIRRTVCEGNRCYIMRANPSIEHIFSELYHVRDKRKPGYMKVKILELLLFLSDLNTDEAASSIDYFSQQQVALIKAVAATITVDLTVHHTIDALAQQFGISTTALKKCFRGVYGTSIYAYLRTYRLQVAQKLLTDTTLSVTEIAHRIGYENPNKFTSAFKDTFGHSPSDYRKRVHLDRSAPAWSGEEF